MAILTIGELALLMDDEYNAFENFLFTAQGARFKYRWDTFKAFDVNGSVFRAALDSLVTNAILTQAAVDRIIAESDRRDNPVPPPPVIHYNRYFVPFNEAINAWLNANCGDKTYFVEPAPDGHRVRTEATLPPPAVLEA